MGIILMGISVLLANLAVLSVLYSQHAVGHAVSDTQKYQVVASAIVAIH